MPQTSFGTETSTATPTSLFDGGGMAGTASGTCASIGSSSLAGPTASASSRGGMGAVSSVGRAGIPLGATELGSGGLSPPSVALTSNPLAPLMTLTPLVVIPPSNPSAPLPTVGSKATCQTTGTGVPSPRGVTIPFGAPLTGNAFALAQIRCEGAH
jgi:hypothetical protein